MHGGGMSELGKVILILGVVLVVVGFALTLGGKLGLGRLPGDVSFQKGNVSFHFPIVTSILLSILLTIILNLFLRR
jgi:hypothetical protein